MKIVEPDKATIMFADLNEGDIFRECSHIYMKMKEIGSYNAICLSDGNAEGYFPNAEVELLKNAYLTI